MIEASESTATKSSPQIFVGLVVSNKMDKTIVVELERLVKHPRYGKYIKRRKKIHAHDEHNTCAIGDMVKVKESRPYSKTKTWVLESILKKAGQEA